MFDSSVSFFNIIVPTADTYKFGYIINKLMSGGFNVLLTGETGVGKSIIMNEFLMKIKSHTLLFYVRT